MKKVKKYTTFIIEIFSNVHRVQKGTTGINEIEYNV